MKRFFKLLAVLIVIGGVAGGAFFGMRKFKIDPLARWRKKPGKTAPKVIASRPPAALPEVVPATETKPPKPTPEPKAETPAPVPPPSPAPSAPKPADSPAQTVPDRDTERRTARLASIYEQMPADEAARIMGKLPDPLVTQMLRRMDEQQVGKLLLAFPTDRAVRLTRALAK